MLLFSLWGGSWLSVFILIVYLVAAFYFSVSLQQPPVSFLLSDTGKIQVEESAILSGNISDRSFYNAWVMFLCVEKKEQAFVVDSELQGKCIAKRWYIIFCDSVEAKEYRLIARLVTSARQI